MAGIMLAGASQALSVSLATIVSEFRLTRQDSGVGRRLATQSKLEPHTGTSKIINRYGPVTAMALTDGGDMAQDQTFADSQSTYTPSEVGVQMVVADTTIRRINDPDLMMRAGRIMANAVDLKEDQDVLSKAASFTAGTIPGTTNVLSPGSFGTMRSLLRTGAATPAMPAPPPYYGIFHPYSLQAIWGRLVPIGSTPGGAAAYTTTSTTNNASIAAGGRDPRTDDLMREGVKAVTRLADIDIFEDANVNISSNSADNMVFAREGLVFVLELAPYFEAQRDASLRATELNMVTSYVPGTYLPANYGVYAQCDATKPSA